MPISTFWTTPWAQWTHQWPNTYSKRKPDNWISLSHAKLVTFSCILDYMRDKCVILVTHQMQFLRPEQQDYVLERRPVFGRWKLSISWLTQALISCRFSENSPKASGRKQKISSSRLAKKEEKKQFNKIDRSCNFIKGFNIEDENENTGEIDLKVYINYFKSNSGWQFDSVCTALNNFNPNSLPFDWLLANTLVSVCSVDTKNIWAIGVSNGYYYYFQGHGRRHCFWHFWFQSKKYNNLFATEFGSLHIGDTAMRDILPALFALFPRSAQHCLWSSFTDFDDSLWFHPNRYSQRNRIKILITVNDFQDEILNRFTRDIGILDDTLPMILFDLNLVYKYLLDILISSYII